VGFVRDAEVELAALAEERQSTGTVVLPIVQERPHPSETDEGPWSARYRLLTIGMLLTVVAWAFEALAVATILPATVDDLGGLGLYGWIFGAFMLANLVGIVVAGSEVDRLGPAKPFAVGIALFVAGLLIGGFAPSMAVLIGARAIQGFGTGILGSVAYAVIGRAYPESCRPRMLALWSTGWVVPGLVGPAIAGVVADAASWRWVFFGIVPFPLIALALTAPSIRLIPPGVTTPRDWGRLRDAVLLAIGFAAVLVGFGANRVLLALPLVVAGGVVGLPSLRRLLPPGTLRAAPGPAAAIAALAVLNLGFFGVEVFIPLALSDLRGQGSAFSGLALTASAITWTIGSWILDRRAKRASRRALVRWGLLLVALGIGGSWLVLLPETPVVVAPLAWGVAGLGIGLAYTTVQLVVLETAPPGQEGTATSSLQLANTLGIALATGIGGIVIAAYSRGDEVTRSGISVQSAAMIGVLLLGVLIAGRLPDRPPRPEPVPSEEPPARASAVSQP
jgi:MFS family permease